MLVGFTMFYAGQLGHQYAQWETYTPEPSLTYTASGVTFQSASRMTSFPRTVTSMTSPGVTIALSGLLIFAFNLKSGKKNTANKSFKQDASGYDAG